MEFNNWRTKFKFCHFSFWRRICISRIGYEHLDDLEKVYSEMAKTRLIGIREYVNSIRVNEALRAVL